MANNGVRGVDWDVRIQRSIKYFADEQLKIKIKEYAEAGRKAMVSIHRDIIKEWFGEYSPVSMMLTINTRTVEYTPRLYEDKNGMPTGRIVFQAYLDSQYYNNGQSIQGWNERNNIGFAEEDMMEYVMSLQLFQGIIGLPKNGMREIPPHTNIRGPGHLDENRRWVNDNFIKRSQPLYNAIMKSSLWSNENWEAVVNSFKKGGD